MSGKNDVRAISYPSVTSKVRNSSERLSMQGPTETVEVTWEDQQDINTFGKMNSKYHLLKSIIDDKKKRHEHLDEAQTELMLVDEEDSTRYLIGECFLHIPNEDADQRLTDEMSKITQDIEELTEQEVKLREKSDGLKEKLYIKFGNQISLDEE